MESLIGFLAVAGIIAALICKMIDSDRQQKKLDSWSRVKK